jgi:hypothetical protein
MAGGGTGSAAPSGVDTGSQSSAPSGGKGPATPIQSYQQSPFASPGQALPPGVTSPFAFGGNANPNISFLQQDQNQQQTVQQNNGALGLGRTAQGPQQYNPNPQQMGLAGLLGGYGKGGGGVMPNPYQPQGGQQMSNPALDEGMVGPGYQGPTQQPMQPTMQPTWKMYDPKDYAPPTAPDPSQPGFLGFGSNQPVQQTPAQQAPTQAPTQPSNMFYNMSAADIDKYNASHSAMKKGGKVK